jgi:hypothetical protein
MHLLGSLCGAQAQQSELLSAAILPIAEGTAEGTDPDSSRVECLKRPVSLGIRGY